MKRVLALAAALVAVLLLSWSSSLALLFGAISLEIVLALVFFRHLLASVRKLPSRAAVSSLFWILALLAWGCFGYLVHGYLAKGGVGYLISEEARAKLLHVPSSSFGGRRPGVPEPPLGVSALDEDARCGSHDPLDRGSRPLPGDRGQRRLRLRLLGLGLRSL